MPSSNLTVTAGFSTSPALPLCGEVSNTSLPALMSNALDRTGMVDPSSAVMVYVPPVSMERSLNVAIPATAGSVSVPANVPVPLASASVIESVAEVSVTPLVWTATVTGGLMVSPAAELLGCCRNASVSAS